MPDPVTPPPIDSLITQIKHLKATAARLQSVLEKTRAGKTFAAGDELRKYPNLFDQVVSAIGELTAADNLGIAERLVREAVDSAKLTYRETLEEALRDATISFSGQWPAYWLADVLRLHIDFAGEHITVGQRSLHSLEPARVVVIARAELKRLMGRPFDATAFLNLVADAYRGLIDENLQAAGEYANIADVLKAIQGVQGRTYSAPLFAVDLYRLKQTTASQEGARLELSPARSPASGLFIPGPAGGYVSALRVTRPKDSADA